MQVGGAIGQYGNCFPLAHGITGVERMPHTIQSTTQLVQHFSLKTSKYGHFYNLTL